MTRQRPKRSRAKHQKIVPLGVVYLTVSQYDDLGVSGIDQLPQRAGR